MQAARRSLRDGGAEDRRVAARAHSRASNPNSKMIKNITRNTTVAGKVEYLANSWARATGLMFRKAKPNVGYLFIFERPTYAAIHMLFVFSPIDVLWLDKDGVVIDEAVHVKPWTPHLAPKQNATFMIELAAGTILLSRTQIGDKLEF